MRIVTVLSFLILISIFYLSSCCEKETDPFAGATGKITDQRDGKVYKWVKIGDQIWFAENLNVGIMIDGSETMTNNNTIEKYCIENNTDNCDELGGLYQWREMMNYDTFEITNGICPEGWHIPMDSEWIVLESFVDSIPDSVDVDWYSTGYRGYQVGKYLKSNLNWVNEEGNDKYGFNAFGAGVRVNEPDYFGDQYELGYYWTSSTYYPTVDSNVAWIRILDASNNLIRRKDGTFRSGRSVRCVKD